MMIEESIRQTDVTEGNTMTPSVEMAKIALIQTETTSGITLTKTEEIAGMNDGTRMMTTTERSVIFTPGQCASTFLILMVIIHLPGHIR